MSFKSLYSKRVPILRRVAEEIETQTREILSDVPRVDRISSRVKSVDRFVEKSTRKGYKKPLEEIQDQIGLRVIVFYRSDIGPASRRVTREFREIENRVMEEPDPEAFSYEARHMVCLVPPEIQHKYGSPIEFFELQICTLFQHAWAEADHDLGYKPAASLAFDTRKRIAWAAAQAWGADTIFDELWKQSKQLK